jgi:5-methylcytosine-specific restriction endonuclease McrA
MFTKKWLQEEYITKRKTLVTISKSLGFSRHKLTDILKKYRIKIRSNSESHQGIQEGINNSAYIDGRKIIKHYCVDCKTNEISYSCWKAGTQRCKICYFKFRIGKNHPNWKGGKPKCIDCGKKLSSYITIEGRCNECYRIHNIGINNHSFIHGQGYAPYPNEFNNQLKEFIRQRDNYECQNCGMTEKEHLIVRGVDLHIHHIDYNKFNNYKNNLITLCERCNLRANHNRNHWLKFYKSKMEEIQCNQKKN